MGQIFVEFGYFLFYYLVTLVAEMKVQSFKLRQWIRYFLIKMCQSRPLFVYFCSFHIPIQITIIQFEHHKLKQVVMMCLGLELGVAVWKAQMNPLTLEKVFFGLTLDFWGIGGKHFFSVLVEQMVYKWAGRPSKLKIIVLTTLYSWLSKKVSSSLKMFNTVSWSIRSRAPLRLLEGRRFKSVKKEPYWECWGMHL